MFKGLFSDRPIRRQPEWIPLDKEYMDVFEYGQELGGVAPEDLVSDGEGHYLNAVIPEIRDLSDGSIDRFTYLLEIFWAGWSSINHHWDEDDYT